MTDAANQYGQALYDLAKEEQAGKQILDQLTELCTVFEAENQFCVLLSTPSIPKPERCQIIDDSLRGKVHPYVLNFLKILTERGYMRQFAECCRVYQRCYNEDNGIITITAVTAVALSDSLRDKLVSKLAAVTGKTIDLVTKVDQNCLGGIRLNWEGRQVDGTVRRRLEDIRGLLNDTVL